jgi:hypothetical protein
MSLLRYVKGEFTHRITEVTKKDLNSFAQERLGHPFSPEYPAVAPPCHPGSSIMTDGHLGVSLTEKQAHHWTGCTYIIAK